MTKQVVTNIYWTTFTIDSWEFIMAATDRGLFHVDIQNNEPLGLEHFANKRFKKVAFIEDADRLQQYKVQLQQYFSKELIEFTIPLDYDGTEFQVEVWEAMQTIPYGEVWSYSQIADKIKRPLAVRAVGAAIGANPLLIIIPCHRVIGKDGSLTGFRSGLDMKKYLLRLESDQ